MDRDRHMTDWIHGGNLHGAWGAGVMLIFATVATMAGFPVPFGKQPLVLFPLAMAIGFTIGRLVGRMLLGGSGAAAQQIYMPGAKGTYVPQHSHIDALEARGNYQGAVDAWEAVAIAEPRNAWPLIRAGELYLRTLKNPAMALERFRGARDVPGITPEQHIYASQKIIDLYLGPLADEGRALVELRRFVHTHDGTREAGHAREAIARLKAARPANGPPGPVP